MRRVVRDNDLKSAYLRRLVFYGAEGMGHWGPYLGAAGQEGGRELNAAEIA